MSDSEDQMMENLAHRLAVSYSALATLCQNLPIEVTIPTGEVSNSEIVPALRRVMEIVEDQPMPRSQQNLLHAACAYWLGAMDLYGLLATVEFHSARGHSVAACLVMADDMMRLLTAWLADNQPRK
ncbi:hypothetical protein [Streptomyces sp. NPDC096153]|uniref:hypothetical protein n=1 Tax=Streptomyces sp. NPDC096153 TaxID=3155548 RepID=UPI003327A1DA